MRHHGRELRAELFKYAKRKRTALDGTVPGLESTHYVGGLHPAGHSGHAEIEPAARHEVYDPVQSAYAWDGPRYDPPPAWFEGFRVRPTPPLRIGGGFHRGQEPGESLPDEGTGLPVNFMESLVEELERGTIGAAETGDRESVLPIDTQGPGAGSPSLGFGDLTEPAADPLAGHPWYGDPTMTAEMFEAAMADVLAPGLAAEPALEPMEPPAPEAALFEPPPEPDLEARILEEPMPGEPPDPYAAQQQMYDDPMQQLMAPFMMQGFGPGMMGPGFGPMPGP